MAFTIPLIGDFADLGLNDFQIGPGNARKIKAYMRTNLGPNDALIDVTSGLELLGDTPITILSNGTWSVDLLDTSSTDLNVEANTLQYELIAEYTSTGSPAKRVYRSGWFALTEADLELVDDVPMAVFSSLDLDLPSVTPSWRSAFAAEMEAVLAETEAARDGAVAIVGPVDATVEGLIKNTGGVGPLTSAALAGTYAARWKPATTYAIGDKVTTPSGQLAVAKTAHTSGATFTGNTNWIIGQQAGDPIPTVKPLGDGRPGVWEWTHDDSFGHGIHALAGANMAHGYGLYAAGIDNDGVGFFASNKKSGRGYVLAQGANIIASNAYGFHGEQLSTVAPLMRLEQQAVGGADILQLIGVNGKSGNLLYAYADGSEVGTIKADTGKIRWQRDIAVWDRASDSTEQFLLSSTSTGANSANTRKAYRGSGKDYFFGNTGVAGAYYAYVIDHGGSQLHFRVAPNVTAADPLNPQPSEIASLTTVVGMRYSSGAPQLGFFAAAPTAKATITGSRGGNAALAALITELAAKGLITDGTSA